MGLGNYSKTTGFPEGDVSLTWETHQFSNDRGRRFSIDRMDDVESFGLVSSRMVGELIEYKNPEEQTKNYKTIRSKLGNKNTKLIPRQIKKYIPETMVMKQGETLYKLAKKVYGEASTKSEQLAKINNIFDRNKDLAGEIIDMLPLD